MATPKWAPGKLYPPGSLVVPRTAPPVADASITNADFEDGATDWALEAGVSIAAAGGFSGPGCAQFSGGAGPMRILHAPITVTPGKTITASAMYQQGAASANRNVGWVVLVWFDENGDELTPSKGSVVTEGSGGAWKVSTVTGQAPAGAVSVAIGGVSDRTAGNPNSSWFDHFTWNYTSATAPSGLVYRAVQPATGYSDTDEPAWPLSVGVQVVDNEVIWEGVLASRVVWEASPILLSGPVEPVWPEVVGGYVSDNTVSWRTISRRVEDPNCPESDIVVIATGKVYVGDDDIVRYSATVNPLDWSTLDDAGYLPTGLQQYGANPVAAMGLYRGNLVPFNAEAFQMWQIDEDPANAALLDALPLGSTRHFALTPVSNDLFFLSSQGVRTVGIAGASTNLEAGDVGMPIDSLVQAAVSAASGVGIEPMALYYPAAGQYWLIFSDPGAPPTGGGDPGTPASSEVFVYTMTRIGSVGAWSRYLFPYRIDDWAIKGDDLYLRAEDKVFRVSEDLLGDKLDFEGSATPFVGVIQWPWLDFGQPGVTKMMVGFDCVCDGAPMIEFGYDQTNYGRFTSPYLVPADTVPGLIIPMPLSAPSFSVRLTFDGSESWHFLALNLYMSDNRMTS